MEAVIPKKVSFSVNYLLAFVAKRKNDSGMIYPKLLGREIEHIKRIYLSLTKKVIDTK